MDPEDARNAVNNTLFPPEQTPDSGSSVCVPILPVSMD
jgi:hypothetical protein